MENRSGDATERREYVQSRFSVDGAGPNAVDALEFALKRATDNARELAAKDFPGMVEIACEVTPMPMSFGQTFTVTITLAPKP